jgi:hypothetical protein
LASPAGSRSGASSKRAQLHVPPNSNAAVAYRFGDPFFDTDFGLSKKFTYKERARLTVAGEVFNAFNIANLQLAGYNFLLGTPTFGQATTRIIQTFGSGGPRAFEVLARISF